MIVGLNHIAIAVPDFEEAIERFLLDFGLNFKGTEDVVSAKTKTAFFPIEGTQIELIHPLSAESPVQKFLDKRGGGLHHICFETDALDEDVLRLKERAIDLSRTSLKWGHTILGSFSFIPSRQVVY